MGNVINLRRARKQKNRDEKAATAKVRRAEFSQSKSDKSARNARERLRNQYLDDHKLDD